MENTAVFRKPTSDVLEQMEDYGHEHILFFNDKSLGLKGIIAVHDSTLGPALGGCRIWNYANETDALYDVLRLSRGMTYKSSINGINLGGGKAIIINSDKNLRTEAYWKRFGEFVESLNGTYVTAEDVGTSTQEMSYIMQTTKHLAGRPENAGGTGDPSPVTAYGVYLGIKAAAKFTYGNDSLHGKKIVMQGVGHVGQYLLDNLAKEGAVITVADINEANLKVVSAKHKVHIISPDEVFAQDADIFAPCALGAILNTETIHQLNVRIVAGAANNQLQNEVMHGHQLKDKNIVYAPDFLINGGGVINCYREVANLTEKETYELVEKIYGKTLEVLERAKSENSTPQETAIVIAKERIEKAKNKRPL